MTGYSNKMHYSASQSPTTAPWEVNGHVRTIELTPEMVRAGAAALMQHGVLVSPNMDMDQGCELAEEVFRAMISHSR